MVERKEVTIGTHSAWRDTVGRPIHAHGGAMIWHGGIYYWYGEDRSGPTRRGRGSEFRSDFIGITCYSSTDLQTWEYHGHVLSAVGGTERHDLGPDGVVERPRVLYNQRLREFVMWLHIDVEDYSYARAGVAVSDSPVGPFNYLGSLWPNGGDSRDLTVFQDDDGAAYLIHASDWNRTLNVARLDSTYRNLTGEYVKAFVDQSREAPIVFKANSRFHMITSGCSGWHPNSALRASSDVMLGRWFVVDCPCEGPNARETFGSQGTFAFRVASASNQHVFMADRWVPDDLSASSYLWLPIETEQDAIAIRWRDSWSVDLAPNPEGLSS